MADGSLADIRASGIYQIRNIVNGKRYIGSAVCFEKRWRTHRCELGKGRHNPHMQNAWRKYGELAFIFEIIEVVEDANNLLVREQHYLDLLRPEYNVAKKAGSNLGNKMSPETCSRMSENSKRMWSNPECRRRIIDARKGYKLTPKHRANISAANMGRKLSPNHAAINSARLATQNRSEKHRAAMSSFWKGRPKTPEQIEKVAATKRGKPAHNKGIPASEEQKSKQAEIMRSIYKNDPSFREKISEATKAAMKRPEVAEKFKRAMEARRGKKQSTATILRRSESMRAAWARKKASNTAWRPKQKMAV